MIVGDAVASTRATTGSSAFARPKSNTFTVPSGRTLTFAGLQVAVDDALLVCRFEGVGNLLRHRQRFIDWNRPLRDAVGKRRSLDQLQDEGVHAGGLFEAVNGGDVRMVEGGQDLRFAAEAGKSIGIARERLGQNFQRHVTIERAVAGAIDLAHAASADGRDHFVGPEAST